MFQNRLTSWISSCRIPRSRIPGLTLWQRPRKPRLLPRSSPSPNCQPAMHPRIVWWPNNTKKRGRQWVKIDLSSNRSTSPNSLIETDWSWPVSPAQELLTTPGFSSDACRIGPAQKLIDIPSERTQLLPWRPKIKDDYEKNTVGSINTSRAILSNPSQSLKHSRS